MIKLEINNKLDRTEFFVQAPQESHAAHTMNESFELWHQGECRAVYLPEQPLSELKRAVLSIRKIWGSSKHDHGYRGQFFGYFPRYGERDYCMPAVFNHGHPNTFDTLRFHAERFSLLYQMLFPSKYDLSRKAVESILPEWILGTSVFTTGKIESDVPLCYQTNLGVFPDTLSVMAIFKRHVIGGHIILPEYNLKIACSDSSLLIFDERDFYGYTPMVKMDSEAFRHDVLFYANTGLEQCVASRDEIRRAQVQRTKVEMMHAGIKSNR